MERSPLLFSRSGAGPQSTQIHFVVEPERVSYFARYLGRTSDRSLTCDATGLAEHVVAGWLTHATHADAALSRLGDLRATRFVVSVLPPSFLIGASESETGLILFGQPMRCASYSTAIIAHEIAHIALAHAGISNWMVGEVVAFLVEGEVYRQAEGAALNELWNANDLDEFHGMALAEALRSAALWRTANGSLDGLVAGISDSVGPTRLSARPPRGLLRNLQTADSQPG